MRDQLRAVLRNFVYESNFDTTDSLNEYILEQLTNKKMSEIYSIENGIIRGKEKGTTGYIGQASDYDIHIEGIWLYTERDNKNWMMEHCETIKSAIKKALCKSGLTCILADDTVVDWYMLDETTVIYSNCFIRAASDDDRYFLCFV